MSTKRQVEKVRDYIERHALLGDDRRVLVGLSGGVDSVVLADILLHLDCDVTASHLNYRLRGGASDGDESFVRAWCAHRKVPLHVRRFDTRHVAGARGESVQETARLLRYEAFAGIAAEADIPAAAVGHHRDDQVETVLLNLFRGSGPEGLAGMQASRRLRPDAPVTLIRPLLCLYRRDITAYARETGLEWREDATNTAVVYKRGALRSRILPELGEYFGPAVTANIARSADLMRAYVESGLAADLRDAFEAAASVSVDGFALDLDTLRSMDEVTRGRVILEGIRRWLPGLGGTRSTVAEIDRLIRSQPGKRLEHPTGEVWRERGRLLFAPGQSEDAELDDSAILKADTPVETPLGSVVLLSDVDLPDHLDTGSSNAEYVDADRLRAPLIIRRWRPGDRFVPLGMRDEKKISDFLTDEGVPPHRKQRVQVVQADDTIVWVIGYRISASVRVRTDTRRVAQLRFHPTENSSSTAA